MKPEVSLFCLLENLLWAENSNSNLQNYYYYYYYYYYFFFFFFFFFYWHYNPGWVLFCSTIILRSCLSSTFALQPIIFILFRSSSTWSIHLNLGLPTGLILYGVHSVIFLVVLVFSILITWTAHLSRLITILLGNIGLMHLKLLLTSRPCRNAVYMRQLSSYVIIHIQQPSS